MSGGYFPHTLDRARVRQAILSPIGLVRKNRRASVDEVTVDGRPVPLTIFDRARIERHRPVIAAKDKALKLAQAEASAPFSLASEFALFLGDKIKSGAVLFGAVALACAGAGVGGFAMLEARQPDSVLLENAMKLAREDVPSVPSAGDERDMYLAVMCFAVVMLVAGLHLAREWFRPKAR